MSILSSELNERYRVAKRATLYREQDQAFADWAAGYGVIQHDDLTQVRVYEMTDLLVQQGIVDGKEKVYNCLANADIVANAVMWLVVHMTYASNVYLDGRQMEPEDFKPSPDGHTGGALNMVPAYTGYLAINSITGITRSWLMGQGHCVAAIDAANLIVDNMNREHGERYSLSDEGLTQFVRDFYSYSVRPDGRPESPLGSHVNAYTAGGMIEGGYLGFAELLYMHAPLPGERLVVFLSDGAFEEQRGSDWAPRWWRMEDSGMVAPIMVANGRRIDQRTTMSQQGGVYWFREHLRLNGFAPIDIDGRDPAAFAWGVFEMEARLSEFSDALASGHAQYPIPLPYAIAEAPKGYGFPGEGTNLAHNLPLGANPATDAQARSKFNAGARRIWVPLAELRAAIGTINNHESQRRVRERDHELANRDVPTPEIPEPNWRDPSAGNLASPMDGVDECFCQIINENPDLRPRVGNPDELRSNRMNATLDLLKHRVTAPEAGTAEALDGAVITALNEEAVVCAALANKGGINIVVTYEAFAVKMLGAIRQEIIFTRHRREAGREQGWLSVPIILSSHTWENGKNEQSHQDPTLCEVMMGEMSDVSRVVFPADWNSAVASLCAVYGTHGEIWTMVIPKRPVADRLTPEQAQVLVQSGALRLCGDEHASAILVAIGAYQLTEALRASERLTDRGVTNSVICMLEPGRFRDPRDDREAEYVLSASIREQIFPDSGAVRVFLSHMRPESLLGVIRPLDTGYPRTRALGYINHGGTFDVAGMLFANRCTWGHALVAVAQELKLAPEEFLDAEELGAVRGETDPAVIMYRR